MHFYLILISQASKKAKGAKKGGTKKRAQRATSNVFAMFDQAQIQEFKEVIYFKIAHIQHSKTICV